MAAFSSLSPSKPPKPLYFPSLFPAITKFNTETLLDMRRGKYLYEKPTQPPPTPITVTCRICLDEISLPNQYCHARYGLKTPCNCKGTSKYVHNVCLSRWCFLSNVQKTNDYCSVCGVRYAWKDNSGILRFVLRKAKNPRFWFTLLGAYSAPQKMCDFLYLRGLFTFYFSPWSWIGWNIVSLAFVIGILMSGFNSSAYLSGAGNWAYQWVQVLMNYALELQQAQRSDEVESGDIEFIDIGNEVD